MTLLNVTKNLQLDENKDPIRGEPERHNNDKIMSTSQGLDF